MAQRGVNKVILIGNLGQDPEVRYLPNGGAVANITLATSEQWREELIMEKTPEKLQTLIYFLTKEAARNSYSDFLEGLGISNEEYSEIKAWFSQLGIKPYV